MGRGRICGGLQLLLGWLQDKCNHRRGANEHHRGNEGKGHGVRPWWSDPRGELVLSSQKTKAAVGFASVVGEEKGVTTHRCCRGVVCQGLGTWVFIFLYPQLGLEILNIVVSSPCEQEARSREEKNGKRGSRTSQKREEQVNKCVL